MTASIVCGIVLAWAVSPFIFPETTARVRVGIEWPAAYDAAAQKAFRTQVGREINDAIASVVRGVHNLHRSSVAMQRVAEGLIVDFECDAPGVARVVREQIIARIPECCGGGSPAVWVLPPRWWDRIPEWPGFAMVAIGAVMGWLAGRTLTLGRELDPWEE